MHSDNNQANYRFFEGKIPIIENEFRRDIASGFAAGTFISNASFPLEGVKKLAQAGIDRRAHQVPLYRGSAIFAANIIPTTTIQFTMHSALKKIIKEESPVYQKFISDLSCGAAGALVGTVVENTIIRQQQMSCGPKHAILDMFKYGLSRPWKSYGLIAMRDSIFTAWMFCINDRIKQAAQDRYGDHALLPAAILSGTMGALLSHPFDTMATRMQRVHHPMSYRMAFNDVLNHLGGTRGFYKGVQFRMALFILFSNINPIVKGGADASFRNGVVEIPKANFCNTDTQNNQVAEVFYSSEEHVSNRIIPTISGCPWRN